MLIFGMYPVSLQGNSHLGEKGERAVLKYSQRSQAEEELSKHVFVQSLNLSLTFIYLFFFH